MLPSCRATVAGILNDRIMLIGCVEARIRLEAACGADYGLFGCPAGAAESACLLGGAGA